jgi:hypothetical protein
VFFFSQLFFVFLSTIFAESDVTIGQKFWLYDNASGI